MQAQDVMSTVVLTVSPETDVVAAAQLMVDNAVSALPVTDSAFKLIGIVSEGDLLHRVETGTDRRRSWWLELLADPEQRAAEFVRTQGRRVADVMTRDVVAVGADAPLAEVAELLEKHRIKRVPVVRDGRPVGIVSRANLVQALAVADRGAGSAPPDDDRAAREAVREAIRNDAKLPAATLTVIVDEGVVHLWGVVDNAAEKRAAEVVAENASGGRRIDSRIVVYPDLARGGF